MIGSCKYSKKTAFLVKDFKRKLTVSEVCLLTVF